MSTDLATAVSLTGAAPHVDAPPRRAPLRLLVWALWFGLVGGSAEIILVALRKFVLQRTVFVSPHAVWMVPVANAGWCLLAACVLLLAARRWPAKVSVRVRAFVLSFVAALAPLLVDGPLHRYAVLVLAIGVATQASRLIAVRTSVFEAVVRRTIVWLVVLVVTAAGSVSAWQALSERRALAQLPSAAPGAPNVLLVVLDTVRAQNLSLYGYARRTTPRLEQVARTGVRFEHAVAPAPWTTPSHASMFTGRWPHEVVPERTWAQQLTAAYPTLAEVLSAHGYTTAGFVANVEYCGYETHLNRGFAHYDDYRVSPAECIASSSVGRALVGNPWLRRLFHYYDVPARKTAADVNAQFLQWLSAHAGGRPFFVFLNYYDAHEPYLPPPDFEHRFAAGEPRNFGVRDYWMHQAKRSPHAKMSAQQIAAEVAAYDGSIAYLDQQIGSLLDELGARGVLANTLVIITSDHGEQFGEHGLFVHGNSLYLPLLRVPLVLSFPGRLPAGETVRAPVSLRDLPATVMEVAQLAPEPRFQGQSLTRFWTAMPPGDTEASNPVFSEISVGPGVADWYPTAKGAMQSVVLGADHYIRNGDQREELYDISSDPDEAHNLAGDPAARARLEHLRAVVQRASAPQA